ncbi:MAG: HAD-IIB family hydrolase [Planctomycetales bacterium]|nr:HAD-IIB family hydrolase [Planctomycetales bacterium]
MNSPLLVFTDLDGCLLNKGDYKYDAALPTIDRLRTLEIPLVLCSSKTQAEMRPLASELNLPWPLVCENGGLIVWDDQQPVTVLGRPRSSILEVLQTARQAYRFRSFTDLGEAGLRQVANLPHEKAAPALSRECTEPILWEDAEAKLVDFRRFLDEAGLSLTQGGRFWHVAGNVNKGDGMARVVERFSQHAKYGNSCLTVAIGDSPIDLPMLKLADIPVIVPQPDGATMISVDDPQCLQADLPGAAGWAQTVNRILDNYS